MSNDTLPPMQRSRSKGGKWISALCGLLGTLMLVAVIVTYLPLTVPQLLGYQVYHVVSGSMAPAIPEGSAVYVAPIRPEDAESGDVVAFWSGGTVVTHRVVRNQLVVGELITKGDANAGEDLSAVPYDDLIGRVEYHVPMLGRLMMIYTSRIGKLYVLCFAGCGVMFHLLAGRLREREREKLRLQLEEDLRRTDGDR